MHRLYLEQCRPKICYLRLPVRILLVLTAVLFAGSSWAQTVHEIDSLQKIAKSTRVPDTLKLTAQVTLSKLHLNINERQALEYARNAALLAKKLGDRRREALSLYYEASAYFYLGQYGQAEHFLSEAEGILQKVRPDTGLIVQILNLKATLAESVRDFLQAQSLYQQALDLARKAQHPKLVILTLINLCELYQQMGLYELAEETGLEALQQAERSQDLEYQRNALKSLYGLQIKQDRLENALKYQGRILAIAHAAGIPEWLKDAYGFAITQAAIGGRPQADTLLMQAQDELVKEPILWAELLNWVASEGFAPAGRLNKAEELYKSALEIARAQGQSRLAIQVLLNLANLYTRQALYPKAAERLKEALLLCEETRDSTLLPMVRSARGDLYASQELWEKSLEEYSEAVYYANLAPDPRFPHKVLANLAVAYVKLGKYEEARKLFYESLLIAKESEDWGAAANASTNLARLYFEQNTLDSAYKWLASAEALAKKDREAYALASLYLAWGQIELANRRFAQAAQRYEMARQLLEPIGAIAELAEVYDKLIRIYGELRAYEKAYALVFPLLEVNQRVFNEENVRSVTRMELEFQHQKETLEQERRLEAERVRAEKARQTTWVIIISAALLLSVFLVMYLKLYRANLREKAAKAQLERQNRLIEEQKNLLQEQNEALERAKRDIEESILYARRIQMAILPNLEPLYAQLPETFVLYLPRDVVSGDFYFFYPLAPHQSLLAVADCTGHGVPGAFMSMIGTTLLSRLAQEEGPKDPAFLLQRLDEELRVTLHHTLNQESIKDGMDIALCLIDTQQKELKFAGAKRPLYLFTPEKELIEFKGSRRSIGGDTLQQEIPFEGHSVPLREGMAFYLFSDGIVDQFGWEYEPGKPPKRTKFMTRRLRDLLGKIYTQPASLQKTAIEDALLSWRRDIEQIDDICIIGVRFTG